MHDVESLIGLTDPLRLSLDPSTSSATGTRPNPSSCRSFLHGLRPVEVCNLKWDSIDLTKARIHVNRAKNGEPSTHPLSGVELRALRRLKRESIESPFVFVSERGSPFTTAGYRKMIAR